MNTVYYCNYEKQDTENKKLFDRNFCGITDKEIIMDFKSNYNICQNYKTIDNYKDYNLKNKIDTCNLSEYPNLCEPSVPDYLRFLKNIDIDSEFRHLNRKLSDCEEDKYLPKKFTNYKEFNDNLIQFNQRISLKEEADFDKNNNYHTDNLNIVKKELSKCNESFNANDCKSYYNDNDFIVYNKCGSSSNYDNCNSNYDNIEEPYLDWTYNNKCNINPMKLIIGPKRLEHECENLFNNNTKRKKLICKKPLDFKYNKSQNFTNSLS